MLKQEVECTYWINLVWDRVHQWELDESGDDISSCIEDGEIFGSLSDTQSCKTGFSSCTQSKDTKDTSLDGMSLLNNVGRKKERVQDENVFSILETAAGVSSSLTVQQKFKDL